jgi:hypothetical protein
LTERDAANSIRLRAIRWRIDDSEPWHSYVVQALDLTQANRPPGSRAPPIGAILLDSCQYASAPVLVPFPILGGVNAGLEGEILPDQASVAKTWLEADASTGRKSVLVTHHPYGALRPETRERVDALRVKAGLPFHVSAHTHEGAYIVHEGVGDDSRSPSSTWLELNAGSVLDWPLEYRTLQFSAVDNRILFRSERKHLEEQLGIHDLLATPDDQVKWDTKPGDADFVLKQEFSATLSASLTESTLKDAMLAAVKRRLEHVKTTWPPPIGAPPIEWPSGTSDPESVARKVKEVRESKDLTAMTTLLGELEAYELTRPKDPKCALKFARSSALWASKYEYQRGRKPATDDTFVLFPKQNP